MSYIYVVGFGDTGRVKVGYSNATPERRVEAHKRNARAFLECEHFEEWISDDHEEGIENEKSLIAWCRERTGTEVGEYFTLPFSEVVGYAKTLPFSPPRESEKTENNTPFLTSLFDHLEELRQKADLYDGLTELISEESVSTLLAVFNPNSRPMSEDGMNAPLNMEPAEIERLRQAQEEYGLGLSLPEMATGNVMRDLHISLLRLQSEARVGGRKDLLLEIPSERIEETMTPLEYVLWSSWHSIGLLDHVADAMFDDPGSAAEVVQSLKQALIGEAECTLRKVRQSVSTYPDGSQVRVIRSNKRVHHVKVRRPWESSDPDEIFGPAAPTLEVV